ncbi:MAG: TerB family tellurite resistance protein [Lentisphaeria bacterium]|jgi:uncharacterized tellurite resistance protein B-like protein|nr:TerB family tellurite resistance protein [Lentisphaeria bacterium]MDP7741159.1 TerB family tellurite resistance protein [Lentisphaeria bacterium]
MKLPADVQQHFEANSQQPAPESCLRAMCDFGENLGETWLLTDPDHIFFCSRAPDADFDHHVYKWADIETLAIDVDRPFAWLVVGVADNECRLKFAASDDDALERVINDWRRAGDGEALPTDESPGPLPEAEALAYPLSPIEFLAAALTAMMEVDGDLTPAEKGYLLRIIEDRRVCDAGRRALRQVGIDVLTRRLPELLSEKQATCMIANLMELAMVDGELRGLERKLMERFREAADIDTDLFDSLYSALVIKNNLSVYSE